MENEEAGAGEMPENAQAENGQPGENFTDGGNQEERGTEGGRNPPAVSQPDFRVVQPEYDPRDEKTHFKDVGALWRNVSQKTGKEFYTLKIGKLRLLVFPNQKMAQQ